MNQETATEPQVTKGEEHFRDVHSRIATVLGVTADIHDSRSADGDPSFDFFMESTWANKHKDGFFFTLQIRHFHSQDEAEGLQEAPAPSSTFDIFVEECNSSGIGTDLHLVVRNVSELTELDIKRAIAILTRQTQDGVIISEVARQRSVPEAAIRSIN